MDEELKSAFFIFILVGIIIYTFFLNFENDVNTQRISNLTDKWIENVTIEKNPNKVANMFCSDAKLVATVSKIIRRGFDIEQYFNFFTNLPNIEVLERNYNIQKITENVYINTAFLKWYWEGLVKPITVRMTFVFRDKCIVQLHASQLPEFNKDIYQISGYS